MILVQIPSVYFLSSSCTISLPLFRPTTPLPFLYLFPPLYPSNPPLSYPYPPFFPHPLSFNRELACDGQMVGPSAVAVASETFQGSGVVEGLDALLSASVNTDATFTALSRVTMRWTNEELLLAVQGISMCIYAYKGRKFNEKYTNIDYSSLRMRRLWLWQFKIGTHELLLSF